jgi:ubiquitin-like protein Nedd8
MQFGWPFSQQEACPPSSMETTSTPHHPPTSLPSYESFLVANFVPTSSTPSTPSTSSAFAFASASSPFLGSNFPSSPSPFGSGSTSNLLGNPFSNIQSPIRGNSINPFGYLGGGGNTSTADERPSFPFGSPFRHHHSPGERQIKRKRKNKLGTAAAMEASEDTPTAPSEREEVKVVSKRMRLMRPFEVPNSPGCVEDEASCSPSDLIPASSKTHRNLIKSHFKSHSHPDSFDSNSQGEEEDEEKITIRIKTLTGKMILLPVSPENTIEQVKEQLEMKSGIPWHQQRLVFKGKQVADAKTLREYDVRPGSVLHLVLALRG